MEFLQVVLAHARLELGDASSHPPCCTLARVDDTQAERAAGDLVDFCRARCLRLQAFPLPLPHVLFEGVALLETAALCDALNAHLHDGVREPDPFFLGPWTLNECGKQMVLLVGG